MANSKTPPRKWREIPTLVPAGYDAKAYRFGSLVAISSVDGPEFHVSCSKLPCTLPSDAEANSVLADFDMAGAEEDNTHSHNGYTRHFWRPMVQA